jgi:serine protease Do
MKNLKFVVFALGLTLAVGGAISVLNAQGRGPSTRERRPMVDVRSLRTGSRLGVMVSDLPSTRQPSQANADSLRAGDQPQTGVRIDEVVQDSPAEQAGIKAGDVVVEYDGERVRGARQFTRLVQETPEGRSVKIGVLRDGKRETVDATPDQGSEIGEWGSGFRGFDSDAFMRRLPEFDFRYEDREPRRFEYRLPEGFRIPAPGSRMPSSRGRLGVSVQSITPELSEYFGAKNGGALVSRVTPESAASKAGLKAGDVITAINGRSIRDSDDLVREIEDSDPSTSPGASGEVTIVILRDKKEMTLKASLTRKSGVL